MVSGIEFEGVLQVTARNGEYRELLGMQSKANREGSKKVKHHGVRKWGCMKSSRGSLNY